MSFPGLEFCRIVEVLQDGKSRGSGYLIPDPQSGTNNWYTQDGYSGGSYANCSDKNNPGVGVITSYLGTLGISPALTCEDARSATRCSSLNRL
jgi:hypothetical protein